MTRLKKDLRIMKQATRARAPAVAHLILVRSMATLLNRGLSAAIAFAYLGLAYFHGGGLDVTKVAVALLLPMACIWFSEAMGEYTGMIRLQPVTDSTPLVFVCVAGWFLLLGLPVILYFVMQPSAKAYTPRRI